MFYLKMYFSRHFQQENSKLVKAYRAISIMGYTYDDQNIFESAYVEYLKTNLIKSTRHLNVYRFPKMVYVFNNYFHIF